MESRRLFPSQTLSTNAQLQAARERSSELFLINMNLRKRFEENRQKLTESSTHRLRQELQAMQRKHIQDEEDYEQQLEASRETIAHLREQVADAEDERNNLQTDVRTLENELHWANQRHSTHSAEIHTLKNSNLEALRRQESALAELKVAVAAREDLQALVDEQQQLLERQDEEMVDAQKAIDALEQTVQEAPETPSFLEVLEGVRAVGPWVDRVTTLHRQLRTQKAEERDARDELEEEVRELNLELRTLQCENERLKSQVAYLG